MPNKMDVRKRFMSVRIMRELFYKLQQEAEKMNISRSDYVLDILNSEVERKKVKLSAAYQAKVAEEIKAEKKKRY